MQNVINCAGTKEVRLWEASFPCEGPVCSGVGVGLLRQVDTHVLTPLPQLDLPRKGPPAWTGWQAPSHTKPSSKPPAQLRCLPHCREWVQSHPGVGKQSSFAASAQGEGQ